MDKRDLKPQPILFPPIGAETAQAPGAADAGEGGGAEDGLWPPDNEPQCREYGGIGRLWFFLAWSIAPLFAVVGLLAASWTGMVDLKNHRSMEMAALLINLSFVAIGLCLIFQRYKNVGASPLPWTLLTLVPGINIYCAFILYCAPEGYWDNGKLDTAGKTLAWIYGLFTALLLALSAAVLLGLVALKGISGLRGDGGSTGEVFNDCFSAGLVNGRTPGAEMFAPPGAIQSGTLASKKLLQDVVPMVSAMVQAKLGGKLPPDGQFHPFLTKQPEGERGSMKWTEIWVFSSIEGTSSLKIDYTEDGSGGCYFTVGGVEGETGEPEDTPREPSVDGGGSGDGGEGVKLNPDPIEREEQFGKNTTERVRELDELLQRTGVIDREYNFESGGHTGGGGGQRTRR